MYVLLLQNIIKPSLKFFIYNMSWPLKLIISANIFSHSWCSYSATVKLQHQMLKPWLITEMVKSYNSIQLLCEVWEIAWDRGNNLCLNFVWQFWDVLGLWKVLKNMHLNCYAQKRNETFTFLKKNSVEIWPVCVTNHNAILDKIFSQIFSEWNVSSLALMASRLKCDSYGN